ncbi:hypothetical protein [Geodermatophilus normandii]|uniref:Uncharacterized protein n=1 Tax=Geodermatophilus normandii TaxID=1137989 RepID=A0A6P0GE13_9ACTN|nr:hypothetical protein [Geodermatophilus normandii]NEM04969.1 hypothetical protein [Geodermatophilus normandii]
MRISRPLASLLAVVAGTLVLTGSALPAEEPSVGRHTSAAGHGAGQADRVPTA